jgi:hypothetical protein
VDQRTIIAGFVVVGIVITVGVAGAFVGIGPISPIFENDEPYPPALQSFDTGSVHCTEDFMSNSSTSVRGGGANTEITYARNLSLSSHSHAIGGPTFERLNESTYSLSIPSEETSEAPRECSGVVRYNASMRIPAGDDPWQVIIRHDGTNITTIYGDSDSSLVGGSASGGGKVSG